MQLIFAPQAQPSSNLHSQSRQARATKSIYGNGPEALPAWALHTACDLAQKMEESERNVSNNESHSDNRISSQFERGQCILAAVCGDMHPSYFCKRLHIDLIRWENQSRKN